MPFGAFNETLLMKLTKLHSVTFVLLCLISLQSYSQVELVQGGSDVIPSGTSSITVNIPTAVDDTKSLLIVTAAPVGTSNGPESTNVLAQLNCSSGTCNSIRIQRYGTTGTIDIGWKIVEFEDSSTVNITRGTVQHTDFTNNTYPTPDTYTETIGATSGKSFVLLTDYANGIVTSMHDSVSGELNINGDLVLTVGDSKTAINQGEIAYQVIDYGDSVVKQGSFLLENDNDIHSIPISGGIPNPDKSWLIYNFWNNISSTSPVDKLMIRGSISGNNVVFDRNRASSNTYDVFGTYFLVEFTDETSVQQANMSFTSSELTKTATLSKKVNVNCAIPVAGYHQRGGSAPTPGYNYSPGWFIPKLINDGADISLTRGETNSVEADVYWSVIQFDYCSPPIEAKDDEYPIPMSSALGGILGDITANDSFDSVLDTDSLIALTISNDGGSGATVDANGVLTIPAGLSTGDYTLTYTICDLLDLSNCDIATVTFRVADDEDGDGTVNSLDEDSDNDGIPNVLDGCSTADLANTVGLGNNLNWDTYSIEGTDIQYSPSISDGTYTAYSGGNIGSAIRIQGDAGDSHNTFKFDTFFSNDVEYLTFKITDFDSDENINVAVFDENNNIYDLTTVGVVSVGSLITQTGNDFVANSINNNIDGNNDAEDIYGSVIFYFPGKVSRIDISGSISYDASIRVSEYIYCLNDYDNDGVKDFLDLDTDSDGIPDIVEAGGTDSDNNGISDSIVDFNNNGIPDIYDTNCINSASAKGNADAIVASSSVSSPTNALGVQDLNDAIIAPGGSITVDLTDSVPVNYLVIIKQQRTSGSGNVPFSIEQSINPTSGFINSSSVTTQNVSGYYSTSYRISTSDARYIRITNTDGSRSIGIDYLSYDFGSLTDCNGTLGNSIPLLNSDSDPLSNWRDLDSDNDGIPDNIEGQPTIGYLAPNNVVNSSNGIDTAYATGFIVQDTDGDDIFDFMDSDSDNDGTSDIQENGMVNSLTNVDTDNDGLDNAFEGGNMSDFYDVNDDINNPSSSILPDTDGDLFSGGDLDYRDLFNINPPASALIDFDGIDDYVQIANSPINTLDQFTLSFWIKPNSLPTGNVFDTRFIIGQKDMFEIELGPGSNNTPKIWTKHSYGAGPSSNGLGLLIDDTNWMNYTVSVDYITETIKIYINGAFISNMGMNGPRLTNSNPLRIGSKSDIQPAIGENFEGWIDEVKIIQYGLNS